LIPAGIRNEVIIGQDHFGFGAADGNIRMRLEDWARFAYWVKRHESGTDCFSEYVKQATKTQINNSGVKQGKSFGGYGYLIWTENNRQSDSYWAVGYGGQRIAWNHQNSRVLIAFSNLESYMDDLYSLYREWSGLSESN
jgi:CubicO group peptidase (beta-lactamase class C family)